MLNNILDRGDMPDLWSSLELAPFVLLYYYNCRARYLVYFIYNRMTPLSDIYPPASVRGINR